MINFTQKILEFLSAIPNQRTRDVISRRFGLKNGQSETLEKIGRDPRYRITRERVRQIEESGFKVLNQPKIFVSIKPLYNHLETYLAGYGDLRREEKIFEDLGLEQRGAISFLLNLGKNFHYASPTDKFHSLWTTNKTAFKKAASLIDYLTAHFKAKNKIFSLAEVFDFMRKKDGNLNEKTLISYIDASLAIQQNQFDEIGLAHWPEIKPRGVRDKSYIILKRKKSPLHFREVTDLINKENFDHKTAHFQTVHNELIKDSRFVLIGRGVYALAEWGYEPGTVSDIISKALKERVYLSKEEIVKMVKGQRLVKENTILINLQNKKLFKRDKEGKYLLA